MDGTRDNPATRAEQLEELIRQAAAQPGLTAVIELSRQDWYKFATTAEVQIPTIERVGVSTDTISALT
jgi:hypothetical protein